MLEKEFPDFIEKEFSELFNVLQSVRPERLIRIYIVGIKWKYSISEVAHILDLCHEEVRKKVVTGEIRGEKIGGGQRARSWSICFSALIKYLIKRDGLEVPWRDEL